MTANLIIKPSASERLAERIGEDACELILHCLDQLHNEGGYGDVRIVIFDDMPQLVKYLVGFKIPR